MQSDPASFNFSQHLSNKEMAILAAPENWRWRGSCFPRSLHPLQRHRHGNWLEDPANCHSPPQRELLLSLSGTMLCPFRGELYTLKAGDIFLFNNYESHGLQVVPGERDFRHLWLHLPKRDQMSSNIHSVNADGAAGDLSLKVRSDGFVNLIFDAWSACAAQPSSPLNRTLLKSVLTTAFLETLGRSIHTPQVEVEKHVIEYIEEYIDNHLEEPLSLASLSKLAGYNPFSFHRIFKHYHKVTLHRYIVSRRIVKARKLLLKGFNVESVSESVGMSSAAVFSRFFKTHAKLSPLSWKKLNRYEIE